jgi:septal ring factor EnvC (AmiA/AmiB activator)
MADTTHPPTSTLEYSSGGEDANRHRRSGTRGAAILSLVLGLVIIALAVLLSKQTAATSRARQELDQANAATAQARTQLASAQSQVADLQSQLSTAKQQQAGLQTQLTQAQRQASELQGQISRAQAALRQSQQQSQSQLADLQSQLKQNDSTVAGLRRDLEQANGQVNDLKAQLTKAQTVSAQQAPQPVEQLRELPLKSGFTKGFFGSKYSLELRNTGPDSLNLSIQAGGNEARTATLKGGETYHVSGLAAGTNVTVQSDGFKPLTLTAR